MMNCVNFISSLYFQKQKKVHFVIIKKKKKTMIEVQFCSKFIVELELN